MQLLTRYDGGELTQFKYYDNLFTQNEYEIINQWLDKLHFISGIRNNGDKIDREQLWFENNGKYFCEAWKSRERWLAHVMTII